MKAHSDDAQSKQSTSQVVGRVWQHCSQWYHLHRVGFAKKVQSKKPYFV